jgi:hypothetical protein
MFQQEHYDQMFLPEHSAGFAQPFRNSVFT